MTGVAPLLSVLAVCPLASITAIYADAASLNVIDAALAAYRALRWPWHLDRVYAFPDLGGQRVPLPLLRLGSRQGIHLAPFPALPGNHHPQNPRACAEGHYLQCEASDATDEVQAGVGQAINFSAPNSLPCVPLSTPLIPTILDNIR